MLCGFVLFFFMSCCFCWGCSGILCLKRDLFFVFLTRRFKWVKYWSVWSKWRLVEQRCASIRSMRSSIKCLNEKFIFHGRWESLTALWFQILNGNWMLKMFCFFSCKYFSSVCFVCAYRERSEWNVGDLFDVSAAERLICFVPSHIKTRCWHKLKGPDVETRWDVTDKAELTGCALFFWQWKMIFAAHIVL